MRFKFLIVIYLFFVFLQSTNILGQTPQIPNLEVVSVIDSIGNVNIQWNYPGDTTLIDGFIIYYDDPTTSYDDVIPLDTIYNASAISYTDNVHFGIKGVSDTIYFDVNTQSVGYRVTAFKIDGGKLTTSNNTSETHNTLFLTMTYNVCDSIVELTWNSYEGWPKVPIDYSVYFNDKGTPETTTNLTTSSFKIDPSQGYNFRVLASYTASYLSYSNYVYLPANSNVKPQYINADYVTVNDNNNLEFSFSLGAGGFGYQYALIFENNDASVDTIEKFSYDNRILYELDSVDILIVQTFRLILIDQCNQSLATSNIATNIVLECNLKGDLVNMTWNAYQDWLGGVQTYEIYRNIGNGFEYIGETSNNQYTDDTGPLKGNGYSGSIMYYVVAHEGPNPYGITGTSRSNIAEVRLNSELDFPEAFTPNGDGLNDNFYPINVSFLPTEFTLIIYNRYGVEIFRTNDIYRGWDGTTTNGKKALNGVYMYVAKFTDGIGNKHHQEGSVTLIKR